MQTTTRKASEEWQTRVSTEGSATQLLTARIPNRTGIPPQMNEAFRRGTVDAPLTKWIGMGCPRSMRKERRARARNAERSSLGTVQNSPTDPTQDAVVYRVTKCGCGRQTCAGCRQKLGVMARRSIKDRFRSLKKYYMTNGDQQMWTLSVSPHDYECAEAAYDSIRSRERVSKLIRKMGWKYAITVLEWHKSGWPHWHVLVWEPVVGRQRMYHCKHKVQETWGEGNVRYSASNGKSAEAAAQYVTKYMIKADEYVAPEWTLDRHNVRTISSTRAWGPINARQRPTERLEAPGKPLEDRQEIRNNREALESCGSQTVVMKEYIDHNGELKIEFVDRFNVPYRYVRRMLKRGAGLVDQVKSCLGHIRVNEHSIQGDRLKAWMSTYKL